VPRFVILQHTTPPGYSRPSHYDLMLEHGPVLRTWACESLPDAGATVAAEQLADHRLAYLDYEGEVSGGRGSVVRVAAGEYELLAESDELIHVRLASPQLAGMLTLSREAADIQRWRVSLAPVDSPSG
jgi:hypothetical protein